MYTNGLKDRFGSPLISMRDLMKHWGQNVQVLDARGENKTANDLWGTTISVSTNGNNVTIIHNDDKL